MTAFNWNDMDALANLCTEDCEVIPFEAWPDAPIYHGREGMIQLASVWWENFSGTHMKIEQLIEEGERIVLLTTHTGTVDGVQVAQPLGAVIDMRDGLMHRLQFEIGFDETLARAGRS